MLYCAFICFYKLTDAFRTLLNTLNALKRLGTPWNALKRFYMLYMLLNKLRSHKNLKGQTPNNNNKTAGHVFTGFNCGSR